MKFTENGVEKKWKKNKKIKNLSGFHIVATARDYPNQEQIYQLGLLQLQMYLQNHVNNPFVMDAALLFLCNQNRRHTKERIINKKINSLTLSILSVSTPNFPP